MFMQVMSSGASALLVRLVAIGLGAAAAGCGAPSSPPAAAVVDLSPPVTPAAPPPGPRPAPSGPEPEAAELAVLHFPLGALDELGALTANATRPVRGVGFHDEVPIAWEDVPPGTLGSPMIEAAQRNKIPAGSFMTNVNVAREPFGGDGPAYADANLAELGKVSTIRDRRSARAGDRPAGDVEADWPNPGGVPYVTLQRYVTNGTDGLVITCSAAASTLAQERAVCMQIIDSFRVE